MDFSFFIYYCSIDRIWFKENNSVRECPVLRDYVYYDLKQLIKQSKASD